MRWLRHPLLVITFVACLATLAVVALLPRWTAHHLAELLHRRIVDAQESEAAELVEQLAALDNEALAHLVELLDDDRQQVRIAAREGIRRKLNEWSDRPSQASDRAAALLAGELAERNPPRDLHNRIFVKLTALTLLRWPLESSQIDRVQFLADCSTILQNNLSAPIAEEEPSSATSAALDDAPPMSPDVIDLPGGDLPIEPVTEQDDEHPAGDEDAPALLPRGKENALPPPRFQPEGPRRIRSSEISPSDQTSAIDPAALQSLSTRSLMRHLHGAPQVTQAAEAELRRRGFDDTTLPLAQALDDPDPRIRQQLTESLPKLDRVDHATWLWELADDDDANVRRTALNILATSNNPQTRQRVAHMRDNELK